MITVLKINKQGNKIISYTCTDGGQTLDLSKEQLCGYIDKKMVSNAKIQVYQGNIIVRVSDAAKDVQKAPTNNSTVTKPKKSVYTILDYINEAKDSGVNELSLADIVVNTNNLAIKKVKNKQVAESQQDVSANVNKGSKSKSNNVASEPMVQIGDWICANVLPYVEKNQTKLSIGYDSDKSYGRHRNCYYEINIEKMGRESFKLRLKFFDVNENSDYHYNYKSNIASYTYSQASKIWYDNFSDCEYIRTGYASSGKEVLSILTENQLPDKFKGYWSPLWAPEGKTGVLSRYKQFLVDWPQIKNELSRKAEYLKDKCEKEQNVLNNFQV